MLFFNVEDPVGWLQICLPVISLLSRLEANTAWYLKLLCSLEAI